MRIRTSKYGSFEWAKYYVPDQYDNKKLVAYGPLVIELSAKKNTPTIQQLSANMELGVESSVVVGFF